MSQSNVYPSRAAQSRLGLSAAKIQNVVTETHSVVTRIHVSCVIVIRAFEMSSVVLTKTAIREDLARLPASQMSVNQGGPRFTLTWFGDGKFVCMFASLIWTIKHVILTLAFYIIETDDLDIHVLTPGGEHIYYGRKFDSVCERRLDHDDIPRKVGRYVESVCFPLDRRAPLGIYTYYVRSWNQRGIAPRRPKL